MLAIAGLIFMMVFIALPSLQRSQRDTQRSNDIARVQTALNQYQANNRGAIPLGAYFYDQYLIVNSGGSQDVFADPDGGFYSLWIQAMFKDKKTAKVLHVPKWSQRCNCYIR